MVRPFNAVFHYGKDLLAKGFDNVDAVVIWGGTDISPSYYGERPHSENQNQAGPSHRDINEWKAMKYALIHKIPIIGVCRGAQFLCVFSGGKLVQHVTGHESGNHNVMFSDREEIMSTTSCHHQMMYPWRTDYQLLAWSTARLSDTYQGEDDKELTDVASKFEPEVVYFPKTQGLAIQGHPEWMSEGAPFVEYCNEMVEKLLLDTKQPIAA
jgi:GMP synthase-like glutamine amidotransferase